MSIGETAFNSWIKRDFYCVEQLLEQDTLNTSPFHRSRALAYRSLIRAQSRKLKAAVDDAKESIATQRSVIGYIALAVAYVYNGEFGSALRAFDLVFSTCLPSENNLLLLIKAIVVFKCGKHDDGLLRVDDLIEIADDQSLCVTVRAQMLFLLGCALSERGDCSRAIELFQRAQEAVPFRQSPYLATISLISGWDFDRLPAAIQIQLYKTKGATGPGNAPVSKPVSVMVDALGDMSANWDPDLVQRCLKTCERNGDLAVKSTDLDEAIIQYSTALSLNPPDPVGLLVKRSNVHGMLGSWENALKDADNAIKADCLNPWGYERRHSSLHALQRYDEAISTFNYMYSLIEGSHDPSIRQLSHRYISPARSEKAIDDSILLLFRTSPLVLIDTKSGRLCDGPERMRIFKLQLEFKVLLSSLTEMLDEERIRRVVTKYFEYVTLSHVWEKREPTFQDVNAAGSVWALDASSFNDKVRQFCEVDRKEGYRWAWSDTCCIDKTTSTVLNQSLIMMYKWYEASAATFVHLADVLSPSTLGQLKCSIWMGRAWTVQELLAPRVIRFYTRDWKPYLDDMRSNHKESPEIMHELADAIGIDREILFSFDPDSLSVREKLRIASNRKATVEEDVAYSCIGIFKSDIVPRYGEAGAALGHLLEEIVTRSGEVTVLAWSGTSSAYNSCLPASLAVYARPPGTAPVINDADMDARVATLRSSLSQTHAMLIHDRITHLPPARFANRRLYLPCVMFAVKKLSSQATGNESENSYRARVSGIGNVEFQTSEKFSLTEPRRLVLVHPWIRDLCDPLDSFTWGTKDEESDDSDEESELCTAPTSPSYSIAGMDDYTRALRLVVRLQHPFPALLLQQQASGEFKRVAAEQDIVAPGIDRPIDFARDIHTGVLEIL